MRGSHAFDRGDFAQALHSFERATTLRPDDALSWESLACTLCNLGRFENSLRAFQKSRELGHECSTCCYNVWFVCRQLGRLEEGLRALDRCLELQPDHAQAWFERGLAFGGFLGLIGGEVVSGESVATPMDGRHEQAVVAFDRVLALEPQHAGAWYCKGATLSTISQSRVAWQGLIAAGYRWDVPLQALAAVEQALELEPSNEEARALKEEIQAVIAEQPRGHLEGAKRMFEAASASGAIHDPEAQKAIRFYAQTVQMDKALAAESFFLLGQLDESIKDRLNAEKHYRSAIEAAGDEPARQRYRIALAKLLQEKGNGERGEKGEGEKGTL
jgi:tetratricopeptide (TPR) repeat protein